jgi:hypothetical protein
MKLRVNSKLVLTYGLLKSLLSQQKISQEVIDLIIESQPIKKEKQNNELYVAFLDLYKGWLECKGKGAPLKWGPIQGQKLKSIILYCKQTAHNKASSAGNKSITIPLLEAEATVIWQVLLSCNFDNNDLIYARENDIEFYNSIKVSRTIWDSDGRCGWHCGLRDISVIESKLNAIMANVRNQYYNATNVQKVEMPTNISHLYK